MSKSGKVFYFVVDIGGNNIEHAVASWNSDCSGKIQLEKRRKFPTPKFEDFAIEEAQERLYDLIVSQYDEASKHYGALAGIAISSPGAVDPVKGIIIGASAVEYLKEAKIEEALSERLNTPVAVDNDGNCAAWSLVASGKNKRYPSSLLCVVGIFETGIGGGIVINGSVYRGKYYHGGEHIGDAAVPNEHDENWHGAASIEALLKMANKNHASSSVDKVEVAKELFRIVNTVGDAKLATVLDEWYNNVALMLIQVQNTYAPEKIFIGGSISECHGLVGSIRKKIEEIDPIHMPEISKLFDGGNARLIGAVYHFRQMHQES